MTIIQEADFAKKLDAAPKALYSDAQLEKKIFDVLTFRWRKTTIIKKVILTEKEWRVERNALGVPTCKVLKCYAITSPSSGEYANTCFATPYEVKYEYLENGTYSNELKWHSSGGRPNYEVACD